MLWDLTVISLQLNNVSTDLKHAYGTILYFEDEDVIKGLQEQMPNYVITLLIGQFKQTQCINLQFGLH